MAMLRKARRTLCGSGMLFAIFLVGLVIRYMEPQSDYPSSDTKPWNIPKSSINIPPFKPHSAKRTTLIQGSVKTPQTTHNTTTSKGTKKGPVSAKTSGLRPMEKPCKHSVGGDGEIHFNIKHLYTARELEVMFPDVYDGQWTPKNCTPGQELAVIIPYRKSYQGLSRNLLVLMHQLHLLLQYQKLRYHIFVVNQNGTTGLFNKGMLMNLGYKEAKRQTKASCMVFHDVSVVPVDRRNSYMCGEKPRHLVATMNNKSVVFEKETVGAFSLSSMNLTTINGFSNSYWGWGNDEDDNLLERFNYHKLKLVHHQKRTGRYIQLSHRKKYDPTSYKPSTVLHHLIDGLNSVKGATLVEKQQQKLFTWLSYKLQQPTTSQQKHPVGKQQQHTSSKQQHPVGKQQQPISSKQQHAVGKQQQAISSKQQHAVGKQQQQKHTSSQQKQPIGIVQQQQIRKKQQQQTTSLKKQPTQNQQTMGKHRTSQ